MNNKHTTDEYSFCKTYFSAGEEVLWQGKPECGNKEEDSVLRIIGIVFLAFGLIWAVVAAILMGIIALLGIPFVAVGIYLLILKEAIRKNTRYVITNLKIYRKQLGRVSVKRLVELNNFKVDNLGKGYGTIYFGDDYDFDEKKGKLFSFDLIECIKDVHEVQKIIYDAARNL